MFVLRGFTCDRPQRPPLPACNTTPPTGPSPRVLHPHVFVLCQRFQKMRAPLVSALTFYRFRPHSLTDSVRRDTFSHFLASSPLSILVHNSGRLDNIAAMFHKSVETLWLFPPCRFLSLHFVWSGRTPPEYSSTGRHVPSLTHLLPIPNEHHNSGRLSFSHSPLPRAAVLLTLFILFFFRHFSPDRLSTPTPGTCVPPFSGDDDFLPSAHPDKIVPFGDSGSFSSSRLSLESLAPTLF